MSVFGVFDRRFRGFRVIEIGGLGALLALALVVYLLKTHAGSETADIDHLQVQIDGEQARVTLLKAEVAKLEQPERLEALSGRYLGLQPVAPAHEIDPQALVSVVHAAPAPIATPRAITAPVAAVSNAPATADAAATDQDAPQ
jgi:hypothetical protein